jgi:voltage-gated potassium channel Kch
VGAVSEQREVRRRRVGSRLESRAREAVLSRRVFPYLVAVTALLAVGTGVIAHVIDKDDFPSVQDGIWWSIQTLSTVGYGDIVPHTTWGRILGGIVIVFGVTFLTFLIAVVTSLFVDTDRQELEATRATQQDETQRALHAIERRLDAIERLLADRPTP